MKKTSSQITRGLLPYVATLLSVSLAVTLRIENAVSGNPAACELAQPAPEMIAEASR